MNKDKTSLKAESQQSCLGVVMRSNIRLLVWGWCVMWGILGFIFSILWLYRYFT